MANRVQYGVCNLVFVPLTADGSDTTAPTYDEKSVIKVPGTVKITVDYESKENTFSADNNPKYFNQYGNSGNSGEIELALIPDALNAAAHGWEVDANGGIIEIANGQQKTFAMGYQVEGDESGKRCWHYNVKLGYPSEEHNTAGEDITPDTQTLEWSGALVESKGKQFYRYSLTESTANAAVYKTFLDAVTLPAEVA